MSRPDAAAARSPVPREAHPAPPAIVPPPFGPPLAPPAPATPGAVPPDRGLRSEPKTATPPATVDPLRAAAIALLLYAAALLPLTLRLADHPPFAYNWEAYTAWHLATFWLAPDRSPAAILAPTDGLMTNSGQGPLVGLPAALGVHLAGFGVGSLRGPVALLAAAAVPLLWLVGRRLIGGGPALLAAALLACSPVFLLYGRTATLVGPSLVPTLLTALALARVVARPGGTGGAGRVVLLQAALLLGVYAYAPVRLLWPTALALLAVEALLRPRQRRPLLASLAVTALALPLALAALTAATTDRPANPLAATAAYFQARGEHVVALADSPAGYDHYLRPTAAEDAAGQVRGTPAELARRLVAQNAADLRDLLLDRGTRPTLTDFWNPHGRLWPPWLALGGAVGLLLTATAAFGHERGGRRSSNTGAATDPGRWGRPEARLLLALAAGSTLPLLLTSKIHVGRLVPALPFFLLLAALGWWRLGEAAASMLARARSSHGPSAVRAARAAPAVLATSGATLPLPLTVPVPVALIVLLATAASTWADYRPPPPPTGDARLARAVAAQLPTLGDAGAALVEEPTLGAEVEAVRAAALRLALDDRLRLVDLAATPDPPPAAGDPRPPLYAVDVLARLPTGDLPDACRLRYLVAPAADAAFLAALGPSRTLPGCHRPARYRTLEGDPP